MGKSFTKELFKREAERGETRVVPIEITKLKAFTSFKFPRISNKDRAVLKKSIEERGVHDPLQVVPKDGKYIVLTGMTRLEIATELGMQMLPCIVRNVPRTEWEDLVIEDNLARRQLSLDQKKELVPLLRKRGKSLRA
ncbi:MAG: ParB N-terminal domain-containing protein, partial [Nitrososphaeria archaeon]|nr:ParB N-terminal domain-containing protein [Nitrososphaeria archaeon]